jgi:ferredoxin
MSLDVLMRPKEATTMAKRINQDLCIQCDACRKECPNGGIYEIEAVYIIDPRLCRECSGFEGRTFCEEACPVGAIESDDWDWGNVMQPVGTRPEQVH